MKITKIGHCCLFIEEGNLKILTDPGAFSVAQNQVTGVNIVIITHEHADHLHIDSLKIVLANNPNAQVLTNSGVGKKLEEAGIKFTLLEGKGQKNIDGVPIEAFDGKHEEIFEEVGRVQNTGYFIANKLFYPGDSFIEPEKAVNVLALPVAGPWCKIPDAIRYALRVKPAKAFPVHDGMLQRDRIGSAHKVPEQILAKNDITFIPMTDGDEREF